ncbi:MAG: trypsin-like serine protease [Candidatus Hydrogenedentes bacterium]|nr:trypsin-like serine protease [Candidatus Hydrogenedentota bacterium]
MGKMLGSLLLGRPEWISTKVWSIGLVVLAGIGAAGTCAAAEEPCLDCDTDIRFPDAASLLASKGYHSDQYTVLLTWAEATPKRPGHFITGYRVRKKDGSPSFDLYADGNGALLSNTQLGELGIRPKDWTLRPISAPAESGAAAGPRVRRARPPLGAGSKSAAAVTLPPVDMAGVLREDEAGESTPAKGVKRVGVFVDLSEPISLAGDQCTLGTWLSLSHGRLWSVSITSPGALAQRIHFSELHLPPGAFINIYNSANPQENYGPFAGTEDDFWSPTCFHETVIVECFVPEVADLQALQLRIDRVVHVYAGFGEVAWGKAAGPCHLDVTCFPEWAAVASGVGALGNIGATGFLFCTGTLIVDNVLDSDLPFFLTANHCVGSQDEAATLEVYWLYQTSTCNGTAPHPATVPRTTGGADYLATTTAELGNDFALLRLRGVPPSEVGHVGWLNTPVETLEAITGIHHPSGDFKRISFGAIDQSAPETLGVSGNDYYGTVWTEGVTEPGSSGSCLLMSSTQQIIGQLLGGASSCQALDAPDVYGRFDVTFPIIEPWMNGGGEPPNNNFANVIVLAGFAGQTTGWNSDGTKEPGEPNHANNVGGKSVWWQWTAPETGEVTFSTSGSVFDTTVGIYTGTDVSGLTPVVGDNKLGFGFNAAATFVAEAGVTYHVAVDGFQNSESGEVASGNILLTWQVGAPSNDAFTDAINLPGPTGSTTGANLGATRQAGEPDHLGAASGHSVWWQWTAPGFGTAIVSTAGSDFDTTLSVYTGETVSGLQLVAEDDDDEQSGSRTSILSFPAAAGTTYFLAVDGFFQSDLQEADTGNIALAWGLEPSPNADSDIDGNGQVNAVDVQLVINAALSLDIGGLDADINNDTQVDAVDVQMVINAALGLPINP